MHSLARRFAALLAALLFTTAIAAPAVAAEKNSGVVIQMSDADPAKWNLALNNAKNIQTDLGKDNTDVEIVAYGPGIGMLKFDSEVGNRLDEAKKAGVKITACQNTMRAQKLAEKDMHPSTGYVPSGVVQIMKRQNEGWAYIRP